MYKAPDNRKMPTRVCSANTKHLAGGKSRLRDRDENNVLWLLINTLERKDSRKAKIDFLSKYKGGKETFIKFFT